MCDSGSLKGEDVIRNISKNSSPNDPSSGDPQELTSEFGTFDMSMAERDREGDDMSGDEHSSGLQGGDPEVEASSSVHENGMPGDLSNEQQAYENVINIQHEKVKRKHRKKVP